MAAGDILSRKKIMIGLVGIMESLSRSALAEFLGRRPFSVVHVDAEWDGVYRKAMADRIRAIESQFAESVSFGYADCDAEQCYFAREIGLLNVPSVAYYTGTRLCGVVIGVRDVAGNIERLMRGEPLPMQVHSGGYPGAHFRET